MYATPCKTELNSTDIIHVNSCNRNDFLHVEFPTDVPSSKVAIYTYCMGQYRKKAPINFRLYIRRASSSADRKRNSTLEKQKQIFYKRRKHMDIPDWTINKIGIQLSKQKRNVAYIINMIYLTKS